MSIFDELLSIKEFREDQAELGLKKAQNEVTHARREHDELTALLEAFRKQAQEQEAAWYATLCASVVKLRDITDVREDVAMLREGERQRQDKTDKAARVLEQRIEHSKEARACLRQATAVKDKFVDLATSVADEAARELQRKEDLEMEEVSAIRREKQEWSESDAD
jgi:type III secretion protein O